MLPRFMIASSRRWLALASLAIATTAVAADVYISPNGTGTKSGADQSNTKPSSLLQNEILKLTAGSTIYLTSGTYSNAQLAIVGSGTSGSLKRIVGLVTDGSTDGSGRPLFQGTFDVNNSATAASDYLFKFVNYGGAETSHWEIKNLQIKNHGFAFDMPLNGTSFTLRQNILFENLSMDTIEDGIRIRNAQNVNVRHCDIIRHTKKAFRIGFYSRFITFEDCDTNATGGNDSFPTRSIPVGFGSDSPDWQPIIHDLRYIDCTARNNRFQQSSGSYWNGDGYSTERGVYNVTYTRCVSIDNHDGGWDDKAVNVVYDNCIALRNKRGFRSWGSVTYLNCFSGMNKLWGGANGPTGGWLGGTSSPSATIYRSTFHNSQSSQLDADAGANMVVNDSILSLDANGPAGAALTAGTITFNGSIRYAYGSGPDSDPAYIAASNTWELTPADAFNSQTYPTKGYFGQGTATTIPAAPTSATASVNSAQANRIDLTWTDNSSNEAGFRIDRSTNGGAYVTIGSTGTNAPRYMDTGLSYGTSYAYRIYAYNNIGVSSTYASASTSIASLATPAAPSAPSLTYNVETGTSALLAWTDNATNESDYEVQRSTDGTNYTVIATLTENATQYEDTTAPTNTLLYYRVRALNTVGGALSGSQSITVPWNIIIDNLDTANVQQTGTWTSGNSTDGFWGSDYTFNNTSGTAASFSFIPPVTSTATYEVFVRWTSGSNRATNVPIDIVHAGGTTTVTVNQTGSNGVWKTQGTYTFNVGTSGKIVLRNTGANGVVVADAIRLTATTTSGTSPNAPTNLVATAASGTTVNLSWTDQSTNETSFAVERSTDGSAFGLIGTAAANATSYSDTTATAGVTYYYRVRAALSSTAGPSSNTSSTFTPLTVILNNTASAEVIHTPSNGWTTVTGAGSHAYLGDYVHDGNTSATTKKSILFMPTLPASGTYQISARWPEGANRAKNTRFLINGSSGKLPMLINQESGNDTWVSLGTFHLLKTSNAAANGSVEITNEGADEYVIGDAVQFVRVGP